jgi:hypothetical protein
MRSIASRIAVVDVAIALILIWCAHRGQSAVVAQRHTPLVVTCICAGADGLSHVEKVNVKFSSVPGAPETVAQSESVKVTSSYIARLAPSFVEGWHNADARRYVIPISSCAEVEVPDGQKISVEPGQIGLAEDLTGCGRRRLGGALRRIRPVVDRTPSSPSVPPQRIGLRKVVRIPIFSFS